GDTRHSPPLNCRGNLPKQMRSFAAGSSPSPCGQESAKVPRKILIAACLGALALIVGVFTSARAILLHSFTTIEADEARQSIERVNRALATDLHQLQGIAEDYGLWDEMRDFVVGRHPGFRDQTFTRSGLDGLHVQLVWLRDQSGKSLIKLT